MTNNKKSIYTIISFSAPKLMTDSYNIISSSHYLSVVSMVNKLSSSSLAENFKMVYDSSLKFVIIIN